MPERAARGTFRVLVPIPTINALPGDIICVEPHRPEYPMVLTRCFDDERLLLLTDDQRARIITGNRDEIRRAVWERLRERRGENSDATDNILRPAPPVAAGNLQLLR